MTGATGYLGSKLLAQLLNGSENYEITIVKRSFSNTKRIKEHLNKIRTIDVDQQEISVAFEAASFDGIFHFATNYGRQNPSHREVFEANFLLPIDLFELGKKHGVKLFLNIDTMLEKSVSIYSLSKAYFRDYLETNQEGALITNVALEHFFGPGDDTTKFVTRIIRALNNNEPIIALTEGYQKRDFIYVDDVLSALMKIINTSWKKKPGFNTYQIGTGSAISIRHLVETAKRLSGNSETILNFGAIPLRKNEPKELIVNLDSIKKLGWSPTWALEQALSETINYERNA